MALATTEKTGGKPCRDCGNLLAPDQRGCPRCAYNVEAEAMLGRLLWWRIVPGIVVLALLSVALFLYLRT
jgi:hypothetical protein